MGWERKFSSCYPCRSLEPDSDSDSTSVRVVVAVAGVLLGLLAWLRSTSGNCSRAAG